MEQKCLSGHGQALGQEVVLLPQSNKQIKGHNPSLLEVTKIIISKRNAVLEGIEDIIIFRLVPRTLQRFPILSSSFPFNHWYNQ
jgi:hypothetical protein